MLVTLPGLLARSADVWPDRPFLIHRDGVVTYQDLTVRAARFARQCLDRGVGAGERVVIALDNTPAMVATYFGTMMSGAVAVPLPPGPRSDRLGAAIADCAPVMAVVDAATAADPGASATLAAVPHLVVEGAAANGRCEALDALLDGDGPAPVVRGFAETALAAIIYTSGSTGQPRGVMLSHRNFVANATSIAAYLRLTTADRVMCVLPFNYVYGLSLLHSHVLVGGSLVLENRTAFSNVILEGMATHAVTGFAGVPSTFALMLHRSSIDTVSLPHLRYVTQAGGAMAPARITEWLERGPGASFYVMYGATEAAARISYLPPEDIVRKAGSIGRAIPGVEVRVLRDDGQVAASGEVGELVARGANISAGYWNRPDETAARFGAEGYRTGDLGYADDEGYLFLVGRRHDMIKVGANRVGAREIEDVLQEHPDVHEVAVLPTFHDLLGEVPVAFVSLRSPDAVTPTALRAFTASRLAAYKVPSRVVVLPELPKLAGAGKIDRVALRRSAGGETVP